METSAVDHDRLFNLQLTIQRLEEELSLYRNGTTAEQMFDLMKEKEAEISELKVVVADKDSKLRKLAKSSTEVITKFEDLQMANRNTLLQLAELAQSKEEDLKNHILITNEMNAKYEMCYKELESKDVTIAKLTEQARDADQSIQKLQERCAELVNDKAQKFRHLDEQRQEMISKVQTYKESMASFLSERDQVIVLKNERIKELKKQLGQSQSEAKQLEQKAADAQAAREALLEHQETQLASAKAECAEAQRRAAQLEAQSRAWAEAKSEHEATRARLAQAQEKLARYEQAQKRRVLQDTTNTASTTAHPVTSGHSDGGLLDKGSVKNAIRALSGTKHLPLADQI